MVSSINASLSSLLAAGYSQIGQTASAQQVRADEAAAKARLQAEEALKAQTTIQPVTRDGRSPYQGAFIGLEQRQPSLRDFARAKPDIAPSDEVLLFSVDMQTMDGAATTGGTLFEQGTDGVFYAVVEGQSATLSQAESERRFVQRQQQVADPYQRNFNTQFEAQPAYQLAA